jgi:hypothetical protein
MKILNKFKLEGISNLVPNSNLENKFNFGGTNLEFGTNFELGTNFVFGTNFEFKLIPKTKKIKN